MNSRDETTETKNCLKKLRTDIKYFLPSKPFQLCLFYQNYFYFSYNHCVCKEKLKQSSSKSLKVFISDIEKMS